MLQIGDFKIHLISDGTVHVDPGGAFGLIPRALWSRYLEPDENYTVPMVLNCAYVEAHDKKILIDAGLGRKLDERSRKIWSIERPNGDLIDGLARLGVQPEDIDIVINTHLHADHCGGNTLFDADYRILPAFPNAQHFVQRREYEDAMHPNERTAATYLSFNFEPLVENGQMHLLDGDTEILPGITGVVTRGHTPAHMSVKFESGGEYALFVCDLASYAVHFERLGWMTAYDVEPLETLETKRKWQQWAIAHNAVLIFPHDHLRSVGRLQQGSGKPQLEVIDEPFV